ncbi:MAG TPA: hypothetical protein VLK25_08480 [Allosphingosinicella sp.]|nr:hypothetical protein [Allosphingosinicella sp.]
MASRTLRHGALHRLWAEIRLSLCKLNEIQFSAPWKTRRPNC